ncbi:hypothetical protein Tco_1484386 [Tanacetum coccineum]
MKANVYLHSYALRSKESMYGQIANTYFIPGIQMAKVYVSRRARVKPQNIASAAICEKWGCYTSSPTRREVSKGKARMLKRNIRLISITKPGSFGCSSVSLLLAATTVNNEAGGDADSLLYKESDKKGLRKVCGEEALGNGKVAGEEGNVIV